MQTLRSGHGIYGVRIERRVDPQCEQNTAKLNVSDDERPVAIQIYGKDVASMVEAARICEEARPDILDINFGCPVKKVAGKGAGAGMLRNIPLMLEITREVVKAVNIPVTVKTRLGWDADNRVIVDLAEQLQDCGIAALSIHGRTRAQMYTGEADWTLIRAVKNNPRMQIPIIGNGDVTSAEICKQRFEDYGVDAVMIGRASIGRPWIFREVKHYLTTGELLPQEPFSWYLDILKNKWSKAWNDWTSVGESYIFAVIWQLLHSSKVLPISSKHGSPCYVRRLLTNYSKL